MAALHPTYRAWMSRFLDAPSKYGDVAGELVHDRSWRDDIATEGSMAEYLDDLDVADSFRDVVMETFALYLAERRGSEGPLTATSGTTPDKESPS